MKTAYIAGLFDGEGWITIGLFKTATRNRYSLYAGINMTDPRALRDISDIFGGYFKLQKRKKETHRPLHSWIVTTQKASDFIKTVMPFLIIKKEEAALAIRFQERIDRRVTGKYRSGPLSANEITTREWYRSELRRLKHIVHP